MKKYDFDQVIDRRATGALKQDALQALFGSSELTPLWVADLDFAVCSDIVDALKKRIEHPVYGYASTPDSYWQSIIDWQKRRHGFEIERDELAFVPGVVRGVAYAINFFSNIGDKILIQQPVYHPFSLHHRAGLCGKRRHLRFSGRCESSGARGTSDCQF